MEAAHPERPIYQTVMCTISILCGKECRHGPVCRHDECVASCLRCQILAFIQCLASSYDLPRLPQELRVMIYDKLLTMRDRQVAESKARQAERQWQQQVHRFRESLKGNYID